MMKKLSWLALISLLSISTFSTAESLHGKRYAGVSFGFLEAEAGDEEASLTSFEGRFGGYINENLGFEFRAGIGAAGDEIGDADVDLRYVMAALMRIGAPVTDTVFPYLTAGFARADVETSLDGEDSSVAETDFSYGAGVDVALGKLGVFVEYNQIAEIEGDDLSGFAIGIKSSF